MFAQVFHKRTIRRRAVSQIIGSVMMVAIVASVGSILLFQGMNGINSFNNYMTNTLQIGTNAAQESFVIEHVRFNPDDSSKDLEISIRNTGSVDLTINTVAVVKQDDQDLFLYDTNVGQLIEMRELVTITFTSSDYTASFTENDWNDIGITVNFHISVTTAEGTYRSTTTNPYNT